MKNQDVLVFILLAILGFMIWNRTMNETFTDTSATTPVEPAIIQTIINSIQAKDQDLYPLQTIYINPFSGDLGSTVYNARIIFLNTRGYFGVQYDVQADANGKILSMSKQAQPNVQGPFMGYTEDKYDSFDDIEVVLKQQFADLKSQVPGVESKLDQWLVMQRAKQTGQAVVDATSNVQ
jgi:hypothetical protein